MGQPGFPDAFEKEHIIRLQSHFRGNGTSRTITQSDPAARRIATAYSTIRLTGHRTPTLVTSLGTIFAVKKRAPGHAKGIEDILVPGVSKSSRAMYYMVLLRSWCIAALARASTL